MNSQQRGGNWDEEGVEPSTFISQRSPEAISLCQKLNSLTRHFHSKLVLMQSAKARNTFRTASLDRLRSKYFCPYLCV